MENNKSKLKKKALLWYTVSRFITRVIPFGAIVYIYGLYTTTEETMKVTGWSMLAIMFLVFFFYKDVKEWASAYANSKWKYAQSEIKILLICLLLQAFILWARAGLGELEILLWVVTGTQAVALYPSILYSQYRKEYADLVAKEQEV